MEKTTGNSQNRMGTAPMFPLIMSMSLPAIFSMLVQSLYNIVDSYFVAKISENALAAVSLAFPVQNLLIAFAVGTAVGTSSLISRRLGEGRKKEAESAASHGLIAVTLTSVFFAILSLFILRPFFGAFTDNSEIVELGVTYLTICCVFSFANFLQVAIEKILQATGNMIWPMIIQLIGAVANMILDPIFIFGYFGLPAMGIAGAAIATVLGQFIGFIVAILVLKFKEHAMKISLRGFKFDSKVLKDIYAVGFPSIIMQSIGTIMTAAMNLILAGFSDAAYTVFGLYFKLQSFVFMPIFGLTQGLMPIMGFNYGARNKKRMMKALKIGLIIALCIVAAGVLLFMLLPTQLLGIFTDSEEIIRIGVPALRIICVSFISAGICITLSTMFQSVGKGLYSMINSMTRQLVILIPAAWLLSFIGLEAIWFAFPIADFASLALMLIFYRVFKKKDPLFNGSHKAQNA